MPDQLDEQVAEPPEQDQLDIPSIPEGKAKSFAPVAIELGDREGDLVNKVVKNYYDTIGSAWYLAKKKLWDEIHKISTGDMGKNSFPWTDASNCDLGIVEMCADNIKSRYKISTIGAKPMFNTIPITEAGEEHKEKITDSMNYILDNDLDIEKPIDYISQNTVEYGTCPVKLYWKKDILEQKEYKEIDGIVFPDDKSTIEEKGALDVIALEDFIVPEGSGNDIQKVPWIFHRVWMSVYDLEKKVKLGFYSEEVVEKVKAALTLEKTAIAKTPEEKLSIAKKLPEEKVEVLECYMRFAVKETDKVERECIFWVCPSTKTFMKGFFLKDIYFDGKRPFFVYRYKDMGSFYGRGIPEMIAPYRKLMNDVFNFAVNCMMLQMLPWGFYRIGSSFRPEEVRLSPGVMIPVDDINDVKIAQFPPSAQMAEGFVELLMSFVERQTGISSPHMGKEFPTRKTATEVKTVISEGNIKHEDRIQIFQDTFGEMLKGIYHLYRQNQPSGRSGRILTGEDYRFIKLFSAFDQLPDFDFLLLGTLTTGNKVVEREDTMNLYQLAANNPIIAEYPKGQLELLKDIFSIFGKRNVKRFLPPDGIIDAVTKAKMMQVAQQAQAVMSGQMPPPGQGAPQGGPTQGPPPHKPIEPGQGPKTGLPNAHKPGVPNQ